MRLSKLSLTILKMYFGAQKIYSKRVYIICVYRGRLVHSVLLINANIMQIQTMTQIQSKKPAASFIKAICILFKITIE